MFCREDLHLLGFTCLMKSTFFVDDNFLHVSYLTQAGLKRADLAPQPEICCRKKVGTDRTPCFFHTLPGTESKCSGTIRHCERLLSDLWTETGGFVLPVLSELLPFVWSQCSETESCFGDLRRCYVSLKTNLNEKCVSSCQWVFLTRFRASTFSFIHFQYIIRKNCILHEFPWKLFSQQPKTIKSDEINQLVYEEAWSSGNGETAVTLSIHCKK